jgi:hypothetical protein
MLSESSPPPITAFTMSDEKAAAHKLILSRNSEIQNLTVSFKLIFLLVR